MNKDKKVGNKRFTVYDSEANTALELLRELGTLTNAVCDSLDNKTDLFGDHKGSWQGLNRPTMSEEGMRATVEDIIDNKIPSIETSLDTNTENINTITTSIPYVEYNREKAVDFDGKYNHYQGFSNHSKHTYGRYEQATVMSVIGNKDNPIPQVLGTDTKGLATYTNRDSVSLYTENTGTTPILTISSGMTYTNNSATVPYGTNLELIKVGMIIDVGTTVNGDWCVGIIKEINGLELIMEDGFYQVRNDGETPTKVTPINGLQARIQMTNKVWVVNSNLFVKPGCTGGANMELGVLCEHGNINDVGGIDLVNMREATHYGVKVRAVTKGFNDAFISEGNGRHFVGKKGNENTPLLQGIATDNKVFEITMDGALNFQKYKMQTVTSNTNIATSCAIVLVNGSDINLTLPSAKGNRGRIIEIISLGSGNLLTAQPGDGISTTTLRQQQISIAKGTDKKLRTLRFTTDGGTVWYLLSDLS